MGKDTAISWCDATANFWWGCQKVSDGCKLCYAETLAKRTGKNIWGPTTDREIKKAIWTDILKWDAAAGRDGVRRKVFVQSMSDFLEDHPQVKEPRERAKTILAGLKNLDVLLLTKRPENAPLFLSEWMRDWPPHIWMGTTAENQKMADLRIPQLLEIPARVHFLSVEPMLGPVRVAPWLVKCRDPKHRHNGDCAIYGDKSISWVIVGGESGPGCRPMDPEWALDILAQCREIGVAFFMKQDSGIISGNRGRLPKDLWDTKEFPDAA